jgi:thiol-disulfide isomerase/thioredoxin
MRRGGAGLLVAVLALAGCKSTTDPKQATKPNDKTPGGVASRPKGKGPSWLEDMERSPLAGTDVPKAGPADQVVAARGMLGGTVFDPTGRGAKDVYIRIERADATADDKKLPPVGIVTGPNGYFQVGGLKPGLAYTLTAEIKQEGKPLVGVVQTRPPNTTLAIQLRDDVMPPGTDLPAGPGGGLPPPSADLIPPMAVDPAPTPRPAEQVRPSDGSYSPSGIPATKPLGPPPAPVPTPTPTLPPPTEVRPENTATRPRDLGFPPPASIPAPPVPGQSAPPVPPLPPPPSVQPQSRNPGRPVGNVVLLDTMEREWDLASSRSGSLVLIEFMTTTCTPCRDAIPVLVDMQAKYGAAGLQVVGVACDNGPVIRRAGLAKKYQEQHRLNYSLFVEPGPEPGAVRDRLGIEAYPTAILVDASGREVWRGHPAKRVELEKAIRDNLGR